MGELEHYSLYGIELVPRSFGVAGSFGTSAICSDD